MASTAQARALKNYRKRLTKRGMARFEVLGLAADRDLVRTLPNVWPKIPRKPLKFARP